MKYTGKQYVAIDNSYETNLSNPKAPKAYLAGTFNSDFIVTEIVSEPFEIMYKGIHSEKYKPLLFVMLKDGNNTSYITLFFEHGVITESNSIEYMKLRKQNLYEEMY